MRCSPHECIRCLWLVQVTLRDVQEKRLFFDPALTGRDAAKAVARLRQLDAAQADSRLTADVIVVADPANLGIRTAWIAALSGLTIASCRLLWTGHGPAEIRRIDSSSLASAADRPFPVDLQGAF